MIQLLVLSAVAIALYWPTIRFPFVYDDLAFVVQNPFVFQFYLPGLFRFYPARILSLLTFAWNYRLSGLDPYAYHLSNFVLHALCTCLVYLNAVEIFRAAGESRGRSIRPYAFAMALLFAVHPLQTQAVVYVWQRVTLLSGFFCLVAAYCYLLFRRTSGRAKWGFASASLFAFGCAQLCKENSVILPILLVLLDRLVIAPREDWRRALRRLLPWAGMWAVSALLLVRVGNVSLQHIRDAQMGTLTPWRYALTQVRVVARYLWLLFWPGGQNLDYDRADFLGWNFSGSISFVLALCVLGSLLFLAYRTRARFKLFAFGVAWFFVGLAVESSFIPLEDVIEEHRVYLPVFGILLALTVLAREWLESTPTPRLRRAAAVTVGGTVALLAVLTTLRCGVWATTRDLWADVVEKSPHKARGYVNLGQTLFESGDIKGAEENWEAALRIDPRTFQAVVNLGTIAMARKQYARATQLLHRALELDPDNGKALANLGAVRFQMGDLAGAKEILERGVRMRPMVAGLWYNLGVVYLSAREKREAIRCLEAAVKRAPSNRRYIHKLIEARRLPEDIGR